MPTYRGTPVELDTFLEPVVRFTLLALAVPISAVLWWFSAWWWVPVPLVIAMVAHQAYFASRADRPTVLRLEAGGISLEDPARGEPLHVDPAEVHVATVFLRRGRADHRVVLLLADAEGPRLALQQSLASEPELPVPCVDIDAADALLGGQAGILKSVAPLERSARQTFSREGILSWCHAHVPQEAWLRTGLQLRRGEAPPLSPFGFLVGEPDAWIVLDGDTWSLRGDMVTSGSLEGVRAETVRRTLELLRRTDEGPEEAAVEVTHLALTLVAGVRIVFPAPLAAGLAPASEPQSTDLHAHAAEGAALVTHLQRVLGPRGPGALPVVLRPSGG